MHCNGKSTKRKTNISSFIITAAVSGLLFSAVAIHTLNRDKKRKYQVKSISLR